MCNVRLSPRVLPVEVGAAGEDLRGGNAPRPIVFFTLLPPCDAGRELTKLDRRGFRVVLATLWQGVLIEPDIGRRPRPIKEEYIRRNARVGCEDAVWQAHDRVQ